MTTDDRGCHMAWDFDNMLQGFNANGVAALKDATYSYDAIGRRVSKAVDDIAGMETTLFVNAGQQVTCEYRPATSTTDCERKYIYSSYIDEPLLLVDSTTTIDTGYYIQRNRQYSCYALTTSVGAVSEFFRYDPYGKHQSMSSTGVSLGTATTGGHTVTFTGRTHDIESDQQYFRTRMYYPGIGRFVGRDPLGFVDGANLYAAYFAPSRLDPTGYRSQTNFRDPEDCGCNVSDVKLICRTMPSAFHFPGATHCYVGIKDANGKWVETLSGQRDETTGLLAFGDSFWDLNWMNEEDWWIEEYGNAVQYEHPIAFPLGMDKCDAYECLFDAMAGLDGNSGPYSQYTNNSNTLLTNAMRKCRIMANFPNSAMGSDDLPSWDRGTCMKTCLGPGRNIVTATAGEVSECQSICRKFNNANPTPW